MAFTDIPKYLRGLLGGKPKHGWYRVPMTINDDNWHRIVRPPSGWTVWLVDMTFDTHEAALEIEIAYMLGGTFYALDMICAHYETNNKIYPIHLPCVPNAVLHIRRSSGAAEFSFSARGYFLRGTAGDTQRINTGYMPGAPVA